MITEQHDCICKMESNSSYNWRVFVISVIANLVESENIIVLDEL